MSNEEPPVWHGGGLVLFKDDDIGHAGELVEAALLTAREARTASANAKRTQRAAARRNEAFRLRAEGLSIAQIALRLEVVPRTVERYFETSKAPTRRRSARHDDERPG